MIRIELDPGAIAAGELLTGRVRWRADDGDAARAIVLTAQWQTSGAGTVAFGLGRGTRVPLRADQRTADIPVRLLIPHEGPVTFAGELVSVAWKLCVRVNRFGTDELEEKEFVVEPRKVR